LHGDWLAKLLPDILVFGERDSYYANMGLERV
jgi:hypothetical protein